MNKLLIRMAVCLLAMGMLQGVCAADAHVHTPAEGWDRNAYEHWRACECGQVLQIEAHTMQDAMCSVCGSEIWIFEDGLANVSNYSGEGYTDRVSAYDADGTLLEDYRFERTPEGSDGWMYERIYGCGPVVNTQEYCLLEEVLYRTEADGWNVMIHLISYYPDGTVAGRNEYDEYGNMVSSVSYDELGALVYEETWEYEYADGQIVSTMQCGRYAEGDWFVSRCNEYGDEVLYTCYDAAGVVIDELTCEYIYDEAGGKLQSICRSRGMLVRESFYSTAGDEDATVYWLSSEVEYYDDGSKCVFEYDQDGWIIRSTEYDAQGRVVQVDTFE